MDEIIEENISKKKILIIDDEYALRELIEFTLEEDYEILKAENAKEAYELVLEKPNLIILDIMMPKIDGYEVCRKFKQDENTKNIPIIMLTAKHSTEDLNLAIDIGVDEYITKPFEPEFLKKRVDFYLSDEYKDVKKEKRLFQHEKKIHYVKEDE
jgi:DNA-binding response OmpR family regulator